MARYDILLFIFHIMKYALHSPEILVPSTGGPTPLPRSERELEMSNQLLTSLEVAPLPDLAPSRPLHELATIQSESPRMLPRQWGGKASSTVTNDESARSYAEAAARVLDPEFRTTANRVAFVIGEAALVAALPYIHEETVIVADYSTDMIAYMEAYLDALKVANNYADWYYTIRTEYAQRNPYGYDQEMEHIRWGLQVKQWLSVLGTHPAKSLQHFALTQDAVRYKAVVPMHIDINSGYSMDQLGQWLGGLGATITFMNLSNVMEVNSHASQGAFHEGLTLLPIGRTAPILTTSIIQPATVYNDEGQRTGTAIGATGPFFGLDNLRRGDELIGAGHFEDVSSLLRRVIPPRDQGE